ncbi:type VI secretion system-associated protein TagO [Vibrio sp. PP-XX7]
MKLRISNLFFGLIVLVHMLSGVACAAKERNPALVVQQAEQCRDVSERLERLRCFDRVFDTPLMRITTQVEQTQAPVMWIRAMDSAKQIAEGSMMHVTVQGTDDKHGNAWLVLQALNDSSRFEKIRNLS